MYTITASALLGLAAMIPSCAAPAVSPAPIVVIQYDNTEQVDVNPPQRLDVHMTRTNTPRGQMWRTLCDDMGGTLRWNGNSTATCQGTDY